MPKFNKNTPGKIRRIENYKKNETRKKERLHFERNLQSNLDQYVTRAVTELEYRMPDDLVASRPESHVSPEEMNNLATAPHGEGSQTTLMSGAMAREQFPIPIEVRRE